MSIEPESKESIAAAKVPQEEAEEPTASDDIPKDEGDKEEASEGASEDEDDDAPADDSDFKIPLKLTKSGRRRATPFPLKVSEVMNHCCVFSVW